MHLEMGDCSRLRHERNTPPPLNDNGFRITSISIPTTFYSNYISSSFSPLLNAVILPDGFDARGPNKTWQGTLSSFICESEFLANGFRIRLYHSSTNPCCCLQECVGDCLPPALKKGGPCSACHFSSFSEYSRPPLTFLGRPHRHSIGQSPTKCHLGTKRRGAYNFVG